MPASEEAMTAFHEPDYISFLRHVTPDNQVRQRVQAGRASVRYGLPLGAYESSQSWACCAVHGVLTPCMRLCPVPKDRAAVH